MLLLVCRRRSLSRRRPCRSCFTIISGTVVAGQRVEPFYSYLARIFPSTRSLYAAREVISEQDKIRIRNGYQDELETAHRFFIDEYDFYEQYPPTKLRFMYNSFEFEYADRRTQARRKGRELSRKKSRLEDVKERRDDILELQEEIEKMEDVKPVDKLL